MQAPRARSSKKDRAADAVWYLTGTRNNWRDWPRQIRRIRNGSTETSLDLSDSDIYVKGGLYDVYDGRVAAVITKNGERDILIYEHDSGGSLTGEDISRVETPFDQFQEPDIRDLWVDPTNPDRYFATVLDKSRKAAQCPFHFMVTEDARATWGIFSRRLNCTNVYDVGIRCQTETIYVATHHRGILEGDVSALDDGTDLQVDASCDEDRVSESGTVHCTVDFEMEGSVKPSWPKAANSVEVNVALPFNDVLYTLLTPRSPLREAGCIVQEGQDDQGFYVVKRLECTSALDNFPWGRGLPLTLKLDRAYTGTGDAPVEAQLGARLHVNTSPQDLRYRNDTTSTSVRVHEHPKPDRFDPRTPQGGGEIVSNDTIRTPARVDAWTHDRARHHLACSGTDGTCRTNCAGVLTDPSDAAPLAAQEVWVQEVDALSLWSSSDVDYYEIPIPALDSPLMKDNLSNPECGMNTATLGASATSTSPQKEGGKKKKRTDAPQGQLSTSFLFRLDGQYESAFVTATPKGQTLRPVPSNVRSAFASEGESLTSRARITLSTGVNDWANAPRWKIIDGSATYFVEPDGNSLRVLSAKPASSTRSGTQIEVETRRAFWT